MEGYIVIYRNDLTRKDITLINYYLFGRIVKRTDQQQKLKEFYYYPGLFDSTPFAQLSNGCYFTERIVDDYGKRLQIFKANIDLPQEMFKSSRDRHKQKIDEMKIRVKNF